MLQYSRSIQCSVYAGLVALIVLTSCDSGDSQQKDGVFIPLEVGNYWDYSQKPSTGEESSLHTEVLSDTLWEGGNYFVVRTTHTLLSGSVGWSVEMMRNTDAGLEVVPFNGLNNRIEDKIVYPYLLLGSLVQNGDTVSQEVVTCPNRFSGSECWKFTRHWEVQNRQYRFERYFLRGTGIVQTVFLSSDETTTATLGDYHVE